MFNSTTHSAFRAAGIVLAALVGAALTLPAQAADIWKVNLAKSKLGPGASTLVLERDYAKPGAPAADAKSSFLVISGGKLYWATDESQSASSGSGVRTVDYSKWKAMKFVQIGENVRSTDHCGFRCQSGLPDPRMTLTFTGKNMDAGKPMSNILVFNE